MITWQVGDISGLELNQYFGLGDGLSDLETSYFTENNLSETPHLNIFKYKGS